jgi:hypothetical protein
MKYGKTHDCKDCYPLIDLLTDSCIDELNKVFNTAYTREAVKNRIRVLRKQEDPEFFKRLMQQKPGWTKEENV